MAALSAIATPGAFDVADYNFDVSAIIDAVTGGGGGGGTSKPTFSPLTVDLDLNTGLTALLKDIVTGQHIPSIELMGVRPPTGRRSTTSGSAMWF